MCMLRDFGLTIFQVACVLWFQSSRVSISVSVPIPCYWALLCNRGEHEHASMYGVALTGRRGIQKQMEEKNEKMESARMTLHLPTCGQYNLLAAPPSKEGLAISYGRCCGMCNPKSLGVCLEPGVRLLYSSPSFHSL